MRTRRRRSAKAAEAQAPTPPLLRTALFALFAASGFAGLIYESIWTHYLKLFLGHAAYAQALVLALFMGGLAIGSWLSTRLSGRFRNLLVAYAATEAAIGVAGLAFHFLYVGSTGVAYDVILPKLAGSAAAVAIFKWSLCAALILPASVLLGMTFPLMTAGLLRVFPERPGRSLAILYFTNSLGAAAGVLVSGFLLIKSLGLAGTVAAAGAINLAVAAAVWALFRKRSAPAAAPAPAASSSNRALLFFLAAALLTGASSFLYEVAWIRMLSLVLGGSTHSFELMLSAFILGLALGGLFIERRIDNLQRPVRALGYLQIAMGLFALGTLILYGQTFSLMQWLVRNLPHDMDGWALFNLSSNGIALLIMLPATFCAGTTLPLITFHLLKLGQGEASIGRVYAANTVGAIAAVFFATHAGMPLLGVKGLITLGGAIDLSLGAVLLWNAAGGFASRRVPGALSAVSAIAVALTVAFVHLDPYQLASGVFRSGRILDPKVDEVYFHRDGKTATVSVGNLTINGEVRILTNGKTDAAVVMRKDNPASRDEPTMILLGAIPMALQPQARSVACIGFGAGLTTHTVLSNPLITSVDTIEIEPLMVRGAEFFRPRNELAYTDPRSHLVFDDAKTYFSTYAKKYDLIISEPSNPWVSGVAGLFSDEFYRLARRHLAEDGAFVQWLQLYEIDVPLVMTVLKALERNFSDYVVYAATDRDLMVVAKNGEIGRPDLSVLAQPEIAKALDRVGVRNLHDLEARRVGTRKSWDGLSRSFDLPANSDYHPVLDQYASQARFLKLDASALIVFEKLFFPIVQMLSGVPKPGALTLITPSDDYDGARRGVEATWICDALLQRVELNTQVVKSPELHEHARAVAQWLRRCEGPMPLTSVVRLSQVMLPELSTAELDSVWRGFKSPACEKQLNAQDREWLALFQAIGKRNGALMADTARTLLANEPGLSSTSKRYLVAAGMLGLIVEDEPAEAQKLWTEYRAALGDADDLLLRTLVARSKE